MSEGYTPGQRSLAHDLRGGLNRIRLSVGVLQAEDDPVEALTWVDAIIDAADDVVRHLDRAEAGDGRFDEAAGSDEDASRPA